MALFHPRLFLALLAVVVCGCSDNLMKDSTKPMPSLAEFDICARHVKPTVAELRAGVIIKVGTGNLAGLSQGNNPNCSIRFNLRDFDKKAFAQLSFYSPPVNPPFNKDTKHCVGWSGKGSIRQVQGVEEWSTLLYLRSN